MNNIKCLECGDIISKRGNKKYCSLSCSLKNTSIQKMYGNFWKGKKMPEEIKKKISLATEGRLPNSGSFKKGNSINLGRKRKDVGEKNACWKVKTLIHCKQCGKERFLTPCEVIDGRKFCSNFCYSQWHRGKNSPVFKGDKAVNKLRNRIAELPEYKEWHSKILKRDEYVCIDCGSRKDLEVHHCKKRFLDIIKDNNITTTEEARKCKELWDTDNGETLCRLCHRTTDTYGTKGTKQNLLT